MYTIADVLPTDPITYKIKDWGGDPIEGSFYAAELLKTKVPDYYEVEKILDTRKVGKKKQSLVKWYGWDKKFSMWIDDDQISDIKKSS